MITGDDLFTDTFEDLETFEEENENEVVQEGNADENEDETKKQAVKPKRVIRNPQPRLNAETLKGKRGLTALESYFERVKFKGRGHEEQDLRVILKTYEYWCHRLFPKYPFDECTAKIEALGKKKPVITYIKKMRANLLFDEDQIITNDFDSDEETANNNHPNDFSADLVRQAPPGISEEQLERMRLNKERAQRIRQEKLKRQQGITDIFSQEQSASQTSFIPMDDESLLDEMNQISTLDFQENDEEINLASPADMPPSHTDQNIGIKPQLISQVLETTENTSESPSNEILKVKRKINRIIDSDDED